ncbi:MAG: rhomboid family intramembrane serine protease [Pirellulales bacterium]
MRQIGKIERPERAVRFVDYLLTQGISAKTEEHKDEWTIWIHDENQVDQAKSELDAFRSDPEHSRYVEAKDEATAIRKLEHLQNEQRRKNVINMQGKFKNPGMGGMIGPTPVSITLMVLCIGVTAIGLFFDEPTKEGNSWAYDVYSFAQFFSPVDIDRAQVDPLVSIKKGQIWRLITPIFPHDPNGIMHIFFNMYMLFVLGRRTEAYLGSANFFLLCLFIGIGSNVGHAYCTVLIEGEIGPFYGFSGVGYGIFGFMWMKSKYEPNPLTYLPPQTILIVMFFFILCWTGLMGNIANYAHAVGLTLGMIAGAWGKLMQK